MKDRVYHLQAFVKETAIPKKKNDSKKWSEIEELLSK